MLSGLSFLQIVSCSADLNFDRTADFNASMVKFPDLSKEMDKMIKQVESQPNFIFNA